MRPELREQGGARSEGLRGRQGSHGPSLATMEAVNSYQRVLRKQGR